MLKLGTTTINKAYLGSTAINLIYLGANEVFTAAGPVLPKLPAGAKLAYVGDSILQFNTYSDIGAAREYSQSFRGEFTWLNILDQRCRIETTRDTSIVGTWGPYNGLTNGTLAANPFSFQDGSSTVTVQHDAHGMTVGAGYPGGAEYDFSGATAAAGITISGGYRVLTVPTANTFTIDAGAAANATVVGGGASVAFKQRAQAAVPQRTGIGSNQACAADHTEGSIDVCSNDNNFPSSAKALQIDADVVFVAVGTNDINSSQSAASVKATLDQLVADVLAGPKSPRVILGTIRPRGVERTLTLPNNPFTVQNGSNIVTVNSPNHPYFQSQAVNYTGALAVGGLTLTGPYTILSANLTPDSYQFTAQAAANADVTGGGSGVTSKNSANNLVYPVDDPRWPVIKEVNEYIRTKVWGNRVTVCDFDPIMINPDIVVTTATGATGAAKDLYLSDGVHPSPLGAFYAARDAILPALDQVVEAGTPWFQTDPTAAGNRLRNGALQNSGGSVSAGFTGTMPDFWAALRTGGSSLTGVMSKTNIAPGIDKMIATLTSAGSSGVDTAQIRPANAIAWNRASTAVSLTFNVLTTGANPTIRVTHTSLTNGQPIVGSRIIISNASAPINGVTLNGTFDVTAVLNTTTSTCQYEFVATGQTASATGSGAVTVDITYSAQNLFPVDSWLRFGCYVSVSAWAKWRNVQMILQARNGSSGVMVYRAGRSYFNNLRYMPGDAWQGWIFSDPIKWDSEATALVTNMFLSVNVEVENSTTGINTGILEVSRPFLRSINDPIPDWILSADPLFSNNALTDQYFANNALTDMYLVGD